MSNVCTRAPSRRQLRVGENIRHVLFEILRQDAMYEELLSFGIVTFSEVRMSPDLRIATIFVSVLNNAYSYEAIIRRLNENARSIRGLISSSLRQMRHIPELRFRHDDTYENMAHIDKLLAQLPPKA